MSIKTLSPHYITIPLTNPTTEVVCNSFTLKIYIWSGAFTAVPGIASYEITKINAAASAGNDKINISRVVNDFLEFECTPLTGLSLQNGNNQVWVKTEVYYDDAPEVAELENTQLAVKGYGYFLDGENPQLPTNRILLQGDEFKVNRSGIFVLPILNVMPEATAGPITIVSYPESEISLSIPITNTVESAEMVKYLWIDISDAPTDEYIEITYNHVTKTLLITDECRYTPVDIAFQNKEGALQVQTFFKARKDTMSIESEKFESNRPIGRHQFIKYNVSAKTKFTLNSGFVTEDKNEVIKQLLLTERAWIIQGAVAIPINVGTAAQEFKTRQNDRLINYAIEFEYAFTENNKV